MGLVEENIFPILNRKGNNPKSSLEIYSLMKVIFSNEVTKKTKAIHLGSYFFSSQIVNQK